VDHKRSFFLLEQLILKHSAHTNTVSVKNAPDGVDFFFGNRSHALKFNDFLGSVVPIKTRNDKQVRILRKTKHENERKTHMPLRVGTGMTHLPR
jgi:NMD protein affecting ribosome stability and mRNA decay